MKLNDVITVQHNSEVDRWNRSTNIEMLLTRDGTPVEKVTLDVNYEHQSPVGIASAFLEWMEVKISDLVEYEVEQAIYSKPAGNRDNPYGFIERVEESR